MFRQHRRRPDRPRHQVAAAVRAYTAKDGVSWLVGEGIPPYFVETAPQLLTTSPMRATRCMYSSEGFGKGSVAARLIFKTVFRCLALRSFRSKLPNHAPIKKHLPCEKGGHRANRTREKQLTTSQDKPVMV
jgi:hypothetical protein